MQAHVYGFQFALVESLNHKWPGTGMDRMQQIWRESQFVVTEDHIIPELRERLFVVGGHYS